MPYFLNIHSEAHFPISDSVQKWKIKTLDNGQFWVYPIRTLATTAWTDTGHGVKINTTDTRIRKKYYVSIVLQSGSVSVHDLFYFWKANELMNHRLPTPE